MESYFQSFEHVLCALMHINIILQEDEIKETVKKILDGANLEEVTMKTVCKQVSAVVFYFILGYGNPSTLM